MTPAPQTKRLLFVTRHSPLPGEHGSGAYAFDMLRYLAQQGFEITCLWVNEALNGKRGWCVVPPEADAVFKLQAPGYRRFGAYLVHPKLLLRHFAKRLWRAFVPARRGAGSSRDWNQIATARELAAVRSCAEKLRPDAVLANYYWMTGALAEAPGAPLRLVLAHDVFHQRTRDMLAQGLQVNAQPVSPEAEAAHLGRADAVVAITEADAAVFRALLPDREVIVAPKAAVVPSGIAAKQAVRGRCVFVGGESPPNVDGLQWFLREVWPAVIADEPAAELHVFGKVWEKLDAAALPRNVVLRGTVEDLAGEYACAEAVVVPLRAGSGMKIKLVEALAAGSACVSTTVGLQGLAFLEHDEHLLQADAPEEFAHAVLSVLRSARLRERLEIAGRAAVEAHLSPAHAYGPLAARLRGPRRPVEPALLVSIIVNNYNYARFLREAISSALAQTYCSVEVVVVDDGSSDNSREIIAEFGSRIVPVLKSNGGQGSSFNAGFAASHGELVIFLDADDTLHPEAVERIVAAWDPTYAKVHFRLTRVNGRGEVIGTEPRGNAPLPRGNVWPGFLRDGRWITPATSGSAYARRVLEAVLPMPEPAYIYAADAYLNNRVPFHGPIGAIEEPLGKYRVHGTNDSLGNVLSADVQRVRYLMAREMHNDAAFEVELERLGIGGSAEARYRYYHRLKLRVLSWKLDPQCHPKRGDSVARLVRMAFIAVWRAGALGWRERLLQSVWFAFVFALPAPLVSLALARGGLIKRVLKPAALKERTAAMGVPGHA